MRLFLLSLSLLVSILSYAQPKESSPLWLRYPSISPDGSSIAFGYKGDIYVVGINGGKALQITTNPAYDGEPIWSPDSKLIAFTSDRMGSKDIYIVNREGGVPKRLTTHSGGETPIVFKDAQSILFSADILPSAESIQFPSAFSQVYCVSIDGGRPTMFSSMPLENISFSKNGKLLIYNDKKGYEDPWRKHHTSSITRDIWSLSVADTNATKLTNFNGEDRNPVFAPNGEDFYYLSEESGSFNVHKSNLGSTANKQISNFTTNPVRFLSIADNGTLCFSYDGEIYTMKDEKDAKKVEISIITDKIDKDLVRKTATSGATDMAVSKDGKQVAFIYHGDVYVTSEEYATTKQITNTAEQERDIDFSPDGRSILYSSERDGLWQVYQTSIVNKEEKLFPYSTELKEERITNSNVASFQATYSPDGKEIAFLENRTTIKAMNLATKAVRTVMDGKYEYSYSDGDQWYQWSPDSKWILSNSIFNGGWNNKDVALINASGNGEMHNLTLSGYNDVMAKWVLDGKAIIWESDRAGYRSHGSWGVQSDIYIMFFDLGAYEKFKMNKEELSLFEEAEKVKKEEKEKAEKEAESKVKKNKKDKKDGESKAKEEIKPLVFDLENAEYRVARLTVNSSFLGDAVLSKKGDKLYYMARFEGSMDLWVHDLMKDETKILIKDVGYGSLKLDEKGENIYLMSSSMKKINIESGKTTPITFELVFDYKPYAEREYMFEHAWQQVKDKFYDPAIHGIDWEGYKNIYAKFLPHISNNYDFSEMLGEMLGELNGSHTGARYRTSGASLKTATLGLFYDDTYTGDGLKIKEIIKRGPLTLNKNEVKEGDIITAIDGEKILAGKDYFPLLEGKIGKNVILSVTDPSGKEYDVKVKAISTGEEKNLLYERWVERNREMVERLSDGKIGYVHIQSMDSESFRKLYKEVLGRNREKDALVVDTRNNGGGWLHDDIVTLLSGKEYEQFAPRGQYIGSDPFNKWLKPSCMLTCENNYSNAHGTPWVYKTLGIGKLVGAPVPGTMTAVWWETQIDRSIVFGIPQVGCRDMSGNYLENKQLDPDILVYNKLKEVLSGQDKQIEAAVKSLITK